MRPVQKWTLKRRAGEQYEPVTIPLKQGLNVLEVNATITKFASKFVCYLDQGVATYVDSEMHTHQEGCQLIVNKMDCVFR